MYIMKILHISHHIGCMRDHAFIYDSFGFEYTFWKFYDGLFNISKQIANNIWNEKKEYFNSFDYIVTSDTAPLSRIFMENVNDLKPKVVVWICNRFDYNMESDPSFYNIFRNIAENYKEKFKIVPYSDFEKKWCNLKNIETLDTITPIGVNLDHLDEKIDGVLKLQKTYIDDNHSKDKYEDTISILKNKIFIPIYGNDNLFFKLNDILKSHNIDCFNGGYKNANDLKECLGVVHFPDAFSKLITFETIQNEVIVFLPSEKYLIKLHPTNSNGHNYWFNCPIGHLNKDLITYCEWYRFKECRIYFDSIEDLILKIKTLTPEIIEEKRRWCNYYGNYIKNNNINKWKEIFVYKNMIPKIIYMCHNDLEWVKNNSLLKWKKLNPEYEIKLYNDEMCEDFLQQHFGENHSNVFKNINCGIYKSDFWRVCILYIYGGIYVDADIEPLIPLTSFLGDDDEFATCLSFVDYGINPHFIMCKKEDPRIKRCIDQFIDYYNTNVNSQNYLSVCQVFADVFKYFFENGVNGDGKYRINDENIKLMKECYTWDKYCIYNNLRLLNNKDQKYPREYN